MTSFFQVCLDLKLGLGKDPLSSKTLTKRSKCILCLVKSEGYVSLGDNKNFVQSLQLMLRHLNLNSSGGLIAAKLRGNIFQGRIAGVDFCRRCSELMTTFRELYEEQERIRLRLEHCVHRLLEILEISTKITSASVGSSTKRGGEEEPGDLRLEKKRRRLEKRNLATQSLRKSLLTKCHQRGRVELPRVVLRRCRTIRGKRLQLQEFRQSCGDGNVEEEATLIHDDNGDGGPVDILPEMKISDSVVIKAKGKGELPAVLVKKSQSDERKRKRQDEDEIWSGGGDREEDVEPVFDDDHGSEGVDIEIPLAETETVDLPSEDLSQGTESVDKLLQTNEDEQNLPQSDPPPRKTGSSSGLRLCQYCPFKGIGSQFSFHVALRHTSTFFQNHKSASFSDQDFGELVDTTVAGLRSGKICNVCGKKSVCRSRAVQHIAKTHSDHVIAALKVAQGIVPVEEKEPSSPKSGGIEVRFRPIENSIMVECEMCGKRVLRGYHQANHALRHNVAAGAREKPFKCKVCNKLYITASTCRSHISLKHKSVLFSSCKPEGTDCSEAEFEKMVNVALNSFFEESWDNDGENGGRRPLYRLFKCRICGYSLIGQNNLDLVVHLRRMHFSEVASKIREDLGAPQSSRVGSSPEMEDLIESSFGRVVRPSPTNIWEMFRLAASALTGSSSTRGCTQCDFCKKHITSCRARQDHLVTKHPEKLFSAQRVPGFNEKEWRTAVSKAIASQFLDKTSCGVCGMMFPVKLRCLKHILQHHFDVVAEAVVDIQKENDSE